MGRDMHRLGRAGKQGQWEGGGGTGGSPSLFFLSLGDWDTLPGQAGLGLESKKKAAAALYLFPKACQLAEKDD